MAAVAQNFVLLRDHKGWPRARLAGLEIDPEGALMLARIPGVAGAAVVDVKGPYDPALAGFAVSPCAEVILASPFHGISVGTLLLIDRRCADRKILLRADTACDGESAFHAGGLAVTRDRLFMADPHAAAVRVYALPGLERSAVWHGPFRAPRAVAIDGVGRVYVLDIDKDRCSIMRFDVLGRQDTSYDVGPVPGLVGALDFVVTADGGALVSVRDQVQILHFSPEGKALGAVEPPTLSPGLRPGALALNSAHLYVADRATGALWTYSLTAARWLAPVASFRAPVFGLAVDGEGHLYVRTSADVTAPFLRLNARAGHVSRGELEAGPFDAGEAVEWMRVHVDARVPVGTRVQLKTALAAMPATGARPEAIAESVWKEMAALDVLVRTPGPADRPGDPDARLLFVRVDLETDLSDRSPVLGQITAETAGDDYLSRLPAVYARHDTSAGFLRSWLEAFRAELGDRALTIGALERHFDPATAPAEHLPWLASWIGCELPVCDDGGAQRWRSLLQGMHRLHERRGTIAGLREMVRIYTGIECEIVESFRHRALWMLDAGGSLGFDTGLLASLPDGMVVPGPSLPDSALQGLFVEYFLDAAKVTRADGLASDTDPDGSFPSVTATFALITDPSVKPPLAAFSGVWTGQIRAHASELVTFYLAHNGGARLFVDDQVLIDAWSPPGSREPRGSLPLVADHWYPIRIEYWYPIPVQKRRRARVRPPPPPPPRLQLSWSSRSQPKEMVPSACLYAALDDNIEPSAQRHDDGHDHLIVGETVVGAHGPLAAGDFGSPLFADAAHHFTVRVRALDVCATGTLDAVRAVLDAEKPAYTDYHLCVIQPQFCVGMQASIGVDAIVSAAPPPGRYGDGVLGLDTRLGVSTDHVDGSLRVDETLRIGTEAIVR